VLADPEYSHELALAGGWRAVLAVPLLRDGKPVGALTVAKADPTPFSDRQVQLLNTFADQALIAIENVRLFETEQQRTRELSESLEQQTATSEVLKVISSSPGELEPVFRAMLANATNLCGAQFGSMYLRRGDAFELAAAHNTPHEFAEERKRTPYRLDRGKSPTNQMVRTKSVIHVADLRSHESYLSRDPRAVAGVELGGVRSLLLVPMLNEGEVVGCFAIYRQEVRPFTDKQIELVQNFAAQAVIAIENTRLLNELRESLQQQTATADVLKVISSSPGDLEPVFNAMLEKATHICEAKFGLLLRFDGEMFRFAAEVGTPPALAEFVRGRGPFQPVAGSHLERVMRTKKVSHTVDYAAEGIRSPPVTLGGARSTVDVPLLKDNELIGVFSIYRQEVRPFTDKQIALLSNFAAQAVIAIENTRLLNELRQRTNDLSEALEQQTATSEVLQVISSSPGELEPVFNAILANATRICEAAFGHLWLFEGDAFRAVAVHSKQSFADYLSRNPVIGLRDNPGIPLDRLANSKQVVHIPDLRADQSFIGKNARVASLVEVAGVRTFILVPMLKENELIGTIAMYRQEVRPFTNKQVELVRNFAAQAVIAIENARLLNELRQRTTDLSKSLEDLRSAQDRLVQTEKLASLGQLTAGIAHEIKNPLNFVNNFSGVSTELIDELQDALSGISIDHKARAEIKELTDTLRGNLDKVVQHGKRADAIVKNMLLHSREGSGEHRSVDINAIVEESLNLAWHGARAEKQGFNITMEKSLDPTAGEVDVFPQDITRVLLNLISNGFYAATKRKAEANGGDYEPMLTAVTKNLGDRVEIRIRDNGTGIPPEVKDKLFNPFFTTKPAGEGTGLGLSISHDIIVKQHGGSIEVDTQPGEFTEFTIVLPRAGASLAKPGERP
jgi:two-component system, NtrC family, sensor kinase